MQTIQSLTENQRAAVEMFRAGSRGIWGLTGNAQSGTRPRGAVHQMNSELSGS